MHYSGIFAIGPAKQFWNDYFNHFNYVFSALWIYILTRWQHLLEQNTKTEH